MDTLLAAQLFDYLLTQTGPVLTRDVIAQFPTYTKQGIYKALRSLRDQEMILWSKRGSIEIHFLWVQQQIDRLAAVLPERDLVFAQYSARPVTFVVPTLADLERLYGQIFISLIGSLKGQVTNYLFYDVHNYTYVNTTSIVDWYIGYIERQGGEVYLLVGSESPLDQSLRRRNKMKSIHMYCTKPRWRDAISVFGEYIITLKFHKKVLAEFDSIFARETIETAAPLLEKLYSGRYPTKVTIEKNAEKARRYTKVFKQYFFLP